MAGAGARGMLGVAFGMTPDDAGLRASCARSSSSTTRARMTQRTRVFDGVPAADRRACVDARHPLGHRHEQGDALRRAARRSASPLFATRRRGRRRRHDAARQAASGAAARGGAAAGRARRSQCIYVGDDVRDVAGRPRRRHGHGGRDLRLPGQQAMSTPWGADAAHRDAARTCSSLLKFARTGLK